MERAKVMNDVEIRLRGIDALNKALGPSGAFRFLTLMHYDYTDYVEISRRLYKNQTIEEIFERARKLWKEQT